MTDELTDELEEEFFERKAEGKTAGKESVEYVGARNDEFVFHWEDETYLCVGIDHLCTRILSTNGGWPPYVHHEIESNPVEVNEQTPTRGTVMSMSGRKKVYLDVDALPKPLEAFTETHVEEGWHADDDDHLLNQIEIANYLGRNDRYASGTLGQPREKGDGTVAYPFEFDALNQSLEFSFPRPTEDGDEFERFERLVEECDGSPQFIPGTEFFVVPFQDTRNELARDTELKLWALVSPDDVTAGGLLDRFLSLL